jgi:hypothetical protein
MDSSLFLIKEYETFYNESKRKFSAVAKECREAVEVLKEKGQKKGSATEMEEI